MKKTDIKKLFWGMKCPDCDRNFDDKSFTVMRQEDGLFVLQVKCKKCHKGFGIALLGLDKDELSASINKDFTAAPEDESNDEEARAIDYDDILDAHEFIKNLDENWRRYMEGKKV